MNTAFDFIGDVLLGDFECCYVPVPFHQLLQQGVQDEDRLDGLKLRFVLLRELLIKMAIFIERIKSRQIDT